MKTNLVIRNATEVTVPWLSEVLGRPVASFRIANGHGNWSQQLALEVELGDGTVRGAAEDLRRQHLRPL